MARRRSRGRGRGRRRQQGLPLYDPGKVLSGRDLSRAVADLVEGETRPGIRTLDRAITSNRNQGRVAGERAGEYYRGLATQAAQSQALQRQIGERLSGELSGIAADTQRQVDARQAAGAQDTSRDAALRGQGLQGGADERRAQELAAQRAAAATGAQAYRSSGAQQSGNYQALVNALAGARASRGGEIQGEILSGQRKVEKDLQGKRSDLVTSRGPLATKLLLQLREAGFNQIATKKGLDLKAADLAADIQNQATQADIDRDRIDAMIRGQDVAADTSVGNNIRTTTQSDINNRRNNANGGRGGSRQGFDYGSGRTRDQRLGSRTAFNKAVGGIRTGTFGKGNASLLKLLQTNPKKWGPKIVSTLEAELGDADLALAAVRVARGKPIGSTLTRRIQRRYGFTPKHGRGGRPVARHGGGT